MDSVKNQTIYCNLKNLYLKYIQLFKFGIVGVVNTAVDFGVFTLLTSALNASPMVSQVAGYSAGVANSFIMNKLWTFESKDSKVGTHIELLRFVVINAVSLGISLAGIYILNSQMGMNKYLAKVFVTILAQAVNYIGYKMWVFK